METGAVKKRIAELEQKPVQEQPAQRPIYEIAAEIKKLWPQPYYGAVPYLDGMMHLSTLQDKIMHDDGRGIVLRFLCNAHRWKGADAKRIKAELKGLLDA